MDRKRNEGEARDLARLRTVQTLQTRVDELTSQLKEQSRELDSTRAANAALEARAIEWEARRQEIQGLADRDRALAAREEAVRDKELRVVCVNNSQYSDISTLQHRSTRLFLPPFRKQQAAREQAATKQSLALQERETAVTQWEQRLQERDQAQRDTEQVLGATCG